jgi:hypothetical protein
MKRAAATIGIIGLLVYPSVGVAADTSQCWQVQPEPASEGWTKWVSPNGMEYGIPSSWDTDRIYNELASVGLCNLSTESQDEAAEAPTEAPGGSILEQRADAARSRYGDTQDAPGASKEGSDESNGVAIVAGLVGLSWAILGGSKEDAAFDIPLSQRQPVLPAPSAYQQPQAEPARSLVSASVATPTVTPSMALAAPTQSSSQVVEVASPESPVVDFSEVLARRMRPTLISANPRQGKGMVVANAYRRAKGLL